MATKKYSNYIEISQKFESVVDIDADTRNKDLWREYIVGDDMEKMMDVLCRSLNNQETDSRRSFWIEGTYGTGKSYAAILIKHLLEEPYDVVDEYLASNSRLATYRNNFLKCRAEDKGDYLVIWRTGCTGIRDGNTMLIEAEKAVREALAKKFGDRADYGYNSLQDVVIQQINNPVLNWDNILETTDLGDYYGSVEELRENIEAGDLVALQKTAVAIRQNNLGLVDSLETFKKWITEIIKNNGLSKSGIFFIWDEFTEYIANSDDHTILQQLSEFCKVQPFFMLFVVHRTSETSNRITPERYQLITHRFHEVKFHVSTDAAFDLIAGSINICNGVVEHWREARKIPVNNIKKYLPDMSGLDDKISEQIEHLCPMHPMTIKLLSRVAENYAASQRTMFRFMKDQANTEQGFIGYINKEGPESQACWLTPEWLWDYFFTRESDFSDKDTKVAEYIRHYEESRHLVESDENAHRIFKVAMLLLALMSSTKGLYSGRRAKDGISATKDCLETCLAGVISKSQINDLLQTMVDSKILVLDESSNNIVRIQLPFNGTGNTDFKARFDINDKKFTRYQMFSKDGELAQAFEKQAWDDNDASKRRMKVVVCSAETVSINNRLSEITKELNKYPYKLGLLIVTVKDDNQAISIQSTLQDKASNSTENRLVIALLKQPFNDDNRIKWLNAVTKQEMAVEAGQTGAANQYKMEAYKIITSWISDSVMSGKIVAFHGSNVFNNIHGMDELRKVIRTNVQNDIFKYAPENIVVTNTAYRSCNESAPKAGVERKSNNSQLKNVLLVLEKNDVLNLSSIDDIISFKNCGIKEKECIAALAELVRNEMSSSHKVNIADLWTTLQKAPFGYYSTIACGILLGYVFSFYKNSKYTWTDFMQSPHILSESTVSKMVSEMCNGKMSTDYLSAGSITWQNFSEYMAKIFNLSISDLAEQTQGCHNMREAITQNGAPFWALKYLSDNKWSSDDHKNAAFEIIDNIQKFIAQEDGFENAMSDTLTLFTGRGKVKVVLGTAYQDRNVMATAFRTFLFNASPELCEVATRLAIQPEELRDKIFRVMQGSIYTWTEEQVKEKLVDVVGEYKYLEAISKVLGKYYHDIETVKKDLVNLFSFLRIPVVAIEKLNKPWFGALEVLFRVVTSDVLHMSEQERCEAITSLGQYGKFANDCLRDGKNILADILAARGINYTKAELEAVYDGLKDLNATTTLSVFDNTLQTQLNKLSFLRNKSVLLGSWSSITGKNTIKEWCNTYNVPLMWIIPKEYNKDFRTLADVQNGNQTVDTAVVSAINSLHRMDISILTDATCIEKSMLSLIGTEYVTIWKANRSEIITQAKLKIGNDMSAWTVADLAILQGILKQKQKDIAKKEKLAGTKVVIRNIQEAILRERVTMFLEAHPEFCDEFTK